MNLLARVMSRSEGEVNWPLIFFSLFGFYFYSIFKVVIEKFEVAKISRQLSSC